MIDTLLTHPLTLLLLGLATHFIKALAQIRIEGELISPVRYWTAHPYQSALCIIGAVVGYVALLEAGQLTAINAFGVGYMANSVADVLGGRAKGRLA